ncbi:hypothetical protein BJY04DRAFT_225853 [Aspergillus karnatakaensis]|uniref:NAD-dependent epimerase/dehydratase family protein n=1 Tax=Aspergillus karnatakaensis TaxID=1810916 RepID=UPI003CCE1A45
MGKRIIVTGGSGKVGQSVLTTLLAHGHTILNLDITPLPPTFPHRDRIHTLLVDLTDLGQVHSAFTSRFHDSCPFPPESLNQIPDAVIHLAGHPRNLIVPDCETYRVNTQAGFNVLDAATRLGIKKIIIASTVCVYGPPYGEGCFEFPSFPVDEEVDVNPADTYAISKVCVERTARGFARRFEKVGVDIYIFRLAAVLNPEDYERMNEIWSRNPSERKAVGWSYTDARDFGEMCECALNVDGLGYQIFNATNDEVTVDTGSTVEILRREAPGVKVTREMERWEAPLTNRKIREVLGFRQGHSWREQFGYQRI